MLLNMCPPAALVAYSVAFRAVDAVTELEIGGSTHGFSFLSSCGLLIAL